MKNIKKNSVIVICFILTLLSCNDLDLNELAEANSSNWFSSVEEFRASVNEGYLIKFRHGSQGHTNYRLQCCHYQ